MNDAEWIRKAGDLLKDIKKAAEMKENALYNVCFLTGGYRYRELMKGDEE